MGIAGHIDSSPRRKYFSNIHQKFSNEITVLILTIVIVNILIYIFDVLFIVFIYFFEGVIFCSPTKFEFGHVMGGFIFFWGGE